MTELALVGDQHYTVPDPTGGRLVAWADSLTAAHRIGTALCQTAFVPAHFKGKPEEAAAAILFGDEIGMTPTQALQSVHVISGKPGLYARSMVAVVLAAGHEVWTVSKTDNEVVVAGRRKGSTHTVEEKWTLARAQKAGYTSNKKYATDPQSMLYARAASDVCRQVAPDALAGLSFSIEEMELAEPGPTVTVSRADSPKRTVRRASAAPPMLEPSFGDTASDITSDTAPSDSDVADDAPPNVEDLTPLTAPATSDPIDAEIVDDVTPAQLRKIGTAMGGLGMTDRTLALAYVSDVVGRPIESRNDLTKGEAHDVIEALESEGTNR